MNGLRKLDLEATKITDEGMDHLVQLGLERLSVSGTPVGDSGVATLAKSPTIEVLGIGGPNLTNAGLAHLIDYPKLVSLTVKSPPQITDEGLEHIARLRQLVGLQLVNVNITDAGLASLDKLAQLEHLDFQADITDAALSHLANLKSLRYLSLTYCNHITGKAWPSCMKPCPTVASKRATL
jgi:hypothetical protein